MTCSPFRKPAERNNVAAASSVSLPDLSLHRRPGGGAAGARTAWRSARIVRVESLFSDQAPDELTQRHVPSDVQGRARAFQSMTGGGIEVERAAALAGLS